MSAMKLDQRASQGALTVVRRGLAASPELREGAVVTVLLALLSGAGKVVVPILVQQVLDRGLTDSGVELDVVVRLSILGVVATLATAVIDVVTFRRLARVSEDALAGLRARAFTHLHRLSISTLSGERRGGLVSRVTSDVETLSRFISWGGVAWLVNSALMVATLMTMTVYDWRLSLVAVVIILPLPLVLRRLQRHLVAAYDDVRQRVGELMGVVSETVQGAAVVRAYGVEERTTARALAAIDGYRRGQIRAGGLGALLFPSGEIAATLSTVAVIATGLSLGPGGGLSAGELIAFMFLVRLFLTPVAEFIEILDQTQTAVAGWRRVLDVLDTPVEIVEPEAGVELAGTAPRLVADRVGYAYGPDLAPAVAGVSFAVGAGARVALVGATGSGKTTMAKLLTRLADPTEGRILVDGVDLRDVAPSSLRRRLVMVPQDGFLFDTTVGDNVRFGHPSSSDDEVRRAFGQLGLEDWLDGLPDGLDTAVGQRGEHLSVGERQLVALARAHVADPTCLILDEATSSVDPATETRLTRALESLAEGRTSITIAHRLATAERADLVLVLESGQLVESGHHDDLVAAGGTYAGLHASWLDVTAASAG